MIRNALYQWRNRHVLREVRQLVAWFEELRQRLDSGQPVTIDEAHEAVRRTYAAENLTYALDMTEDRRKAALRYLLQARAVIENLIAISESATHRICDTSEAHAHAPST